MELPESEFDVIIIGGGPAGLSAAFWCSEIGLSAILIEKEPEFGGQLLWTFNAVKGYLGIDAANGRDLRDHFLTSMDAIDVLCKTDFEATAVNLQHRRVSLANGEQYSAKSIMIATGVRRRTLGIPGEAEFDGRGVLRSGVAAKDQVAGKSVVIVGGGDAAVENALILCRSASKVTIVHRGPEFTARPDFVERLTGAKNIETRLESTLVSIEGGSAVEAVEIVGPGNKGRSTTAVDAVLIRIGVLPNTELFRGQIAMDESGYISVDHLGRTSVPGTFAIGDVANPVSPTISTAVGGGATAAKTALALINRSQSV